MIGTIIAIKNSEEFNLITVAEMMSDSEDEILLRYPVDIRIMPSKGDANPRITIVKNFPFLSNNLTIFRKDKIKTYGIASDLMIEYYIGFISELSGKLDMALDTLISPNKEEDSDTPLYSANTLDTLH